MLERELIDIGLNEKEAKVYLASLELGQSVVQEIAQKAGVNRATAYFIIEGLMKMGLMSSFHKGKKQFFMAADPDRLIEILEQEKENLEKRKESLKKLLPQLQSVNNKVKDRPVVKYFEGVDGLNAMMSELATESKERLRMAFSRDNLLKSFDPKQLRKWADRRREVGQKIQAIYTYKDGVLENKPDDKRRKVPVEKFNITGDIAVYDDKIRLASFNNRMVGIIIQDKDLSDTLRGIMDLAWEGAEKYQK